MPNDTNIEMAKMTLGVCETSFMYSDLQFDVDIPYYASQQMILRKEGL